MRGNDGRIRSAAMRVLFGALLVLGACGGDDSEGSEVGSQAADELDGLVVERIGPYEHLVADLDYDRPAPSGGDHLPAPGWLNCGVYDGEVPDELAVHSLEHGAAWIALGPDSTGSDREAATELAEGRKVIVSDVPDLPNAVELVAWGVRVPLDTLDDARAEAFLDQFVDASSAPEAGASCGSGFGEPPTPPALPTG